MNLTVGILSAPSIRFSLHGAFLSGEARYEGDYEVTLKEGTTLLTGPDGCRVVALPLVFEPVDYEEAEVELRDVVIGIEFHWERREDQSFRGGLRIIEEEGALRAINVLDIEDYLLSVISSEMSATSSLELLKAHAIVSRSWLVAQREKSERLGDSYCSELRTADTYIRWWDREDHAHFDVCADDHCQRYQGINRATTEVVRNAIAETRGEVLTHEGRICDARFSKCCGGISERFENVWEPVPHAYLTEVYDGEKPVRAWDLTREEEARRWIDSRPEGIFCNTDDKAVLGQVLNAYDQETHHFFRWEVAFTVEELSELVRERIGIDFGRIIDLQPIERGPSGRLIRLRVVGTERTMIIGKELVIRRAFSRSHLYSSAFVVDRVERKGQLEGFRLRGAGWGHGVGLCQIGAAVMGAEGYPYRAILSHYFPGARIEKRWK